MKVERSWCSLCGRSSCTCGSTLTFHGRHFVYSTDSMLVSSVLEGGSASMSVDTMMTGSQGKPKRLGK